MPDIHFGAFTEIKMVVPSVLVSSLRTGRHQLPNSRTSSYNLTPSRRRLVASVKFSLLNTFLLQNDLRSLRLVPPHTPPSDKPRGSHEKRHTETDTNTYTNLPPPLHIRHTLIPVFLQVINLGLDRIW